ncbi:DUF4145 domain-containing protein [Micromonospora haikouensis]|uniref:DUF4145 domain-containing protein n=1 Tax=Micromonospora haikouensis TaxID=686309 RepID=UPI00379B7237
MTDQLAHLVDSSNNFRFLVEPALLLAGDAAMAELYMDSDPDASMSKARRFGETMAKRLIEQAGMDHKKNGEQFRRIEALARAGIIPQHVQQLFHEIRKAGNEAVHNHSGDRRKARAVVTFCFELGAWWYQAETGKKISHTYTPPATPTGPSPFQDALKDIEIQLAQLQAKFDRFNQFRDSDLELSAVTLTATDPPGEYGLLKGSVVLDLKLRNIGGQPAILHRATFHIRDAVSLWPDYLVHFRPYEELWLRGALFASATYNLALPDPEEAAGSHHNLDLSQEIGPAGTDRFHIQLGIPPTMDTLIYLLHFDLRYNASGTITSPAIAVAHPPGSQLVTPDAIRRDLHEFCQAVHEVRDAIDREMTARGLPLPDWHNNPPTSRADLPANLLAVDGNGLGFSMSGAYQVNSAFWNPQGSLTQRLQDIQNYCTRIVNVITDADICHESLLWLLGPAQDILAQLPALRAEFSAPEKAVAVQNSPRFPRRQRQAPPTARGQHLGNLDAPDPTRNTTKAGRNAVNEDRHPEDTP